MPDETPALQRVFEAALGLPPEQQARVLAQACAGDDDLRAWAAALLTHHGRVPAGFLEPLQLPPEPGRSAAASAPPVALVGTRLGRYRILRLIGSGGMGAVYEAFQERPRRAVAIKILRDLAATAKTAQRFELEAEILGRLKHPNVAQIYEAGTAEDGLPYLAMEYLSEARPITAHADAQRLGIRERIELFCAACDGVEHAHQHGVIHRDLKPANILVDAAGQPKVIDFGIARVADRDLVQSTLTAPGEVLLGTVRYMSPEQCEGDPRAIDTRTDVYALGVVLYELLTGSLPYPARDASLLAMLHSIHDLAPRPPAELNRRLRGDLEAILLKSLEKDRVRRYGSVTELAQDLRRHLRGERVLARRPTAWLRAVGWMARHPVLATAAACLLMLGSATLGLFWIAWALHLRPHHMVFDEPWRRAALVARSGAERMSWDSGADRGISQAMFWPREPSFVTIGFTDRATSDRGGLAVFDLDGDRPRPRWMRTLEPADIPDVLSSTCSPADFFPSKVLVADVFSARAGEELIAVHKHAKFTQSAIRIYDAAFGEVLWQVWADFQVESLCWVSDAQLLVLAGLDARVPWAERGVLNLRHPARHPNAVFAIRPRLEFRAAHYVCEHQPEPDLRPAWSVALLPPELGEYFERLVLEPAPRGSGIVDVVAGTPEPSGAVALFWRLDAQGKCVGDARTTTGYPAREALDRNDAAWVPPPNELRWGQLPPIQGEPDDPTARDVRLARERQRPVVPEP